MYSVPFYSNIHKTKSEQKERIFGMNPVLSVVLWQLNDQLFFGQQDPPPQNKKKKSIFTTTFVWCTDKVLLDSFVDPFRYVTLLCSFSSDPFLWHFTFMAGFQFLMIFFSLFLPIN